MQRKNTNHFIKVRINRVVEVKVRKVDLVFSKQKEEIRKRKMISENTGRNKRIIISTQRLSVLRNCVKQRVPKYTSEAICSKCCIRVRRIGARTRALCTATAPRISEMLLGDVLCMACSNQRIWDAFRGVVSAKTWERRSENTAAIALLSRTRESNISGNSLQYCSFSTSSRPLLNCWMVFWARRRYLRFHPLGTNPLNATARLYFRWNERA